MKKIAVAILALGLCATATPMAFGQHAGDHTMVTPADLKWGPVPSLPAGAQIAIIEGPMNEAKPFTVRLKLPANYRIPAHSHPAIEHVTVISGTFNLGMGEKFDQSAGHEMPAGTFGFWPAGMKHFGWTTGETVMQIHGFGPFQIVYVNPADDPRNVPKR